MPAMAPPILPETRIPSRAEFPGATGAPLDWGYAVLAPCAVKGPLVGALSVRASLVWSAVVVGASLCGLAALSASPVWARPGCGGFA